MAGTYSFIGPGSSVFLSKAYDTTGDLPSGVADGSAAVVLADGSLYIYDLNTDTWSIASGGGGSTYWKDPVANFAALPAGTSAGEVRVTLDTLAIYVWDGSAWINEDAGEVPQSRNINTTAPITGGGNLSADRTIAIPASSDSVDGYLTAADHASFAAKVAASRAINTTAPITGGGDLSADRTIAMAASTNSVDGYLTAADHTTFNNKVSPTRSISTTAPLSGGGDLSADRTLSIPVATAIADGYLSQTDFSTFNAKVSATRAINTSSPLTGGGNLSADRTISIPAATTSVDGYLAATDFTTFNNKEPAITAGTTSQYWRGDKSFQTLNIAALLAVTDGSVAGSGIIGEVYESFNALTTTGVGATGVWGSAFSHSFAAGRYIMLASAEFEENGAVLQNSFSVGITTSAAPSSIDLGYYHKQNALISNGDTAVLHTPLRIFSFSGATTVYVNTMFYYSSGTPRHAGALFALRIG